MTQHRRAAHVLAVLGSLVLLAGCAASPGSAGGGSAGGDSNTGSIGATIAAPGDVAGQGTVIQIGDAAPQFCLGPVAESYPPQCSGIAMSGWDWATVDGEETSGDVTWGTYALTGGWDGTTFSVKSSIMLALYDPFPFIDPLLDPDNAGDTSDADLAKIQTEITESAPFVVLSSYPQNGYLFVTPIYDDGSIQTWADNKYLPDVVAVRPALRDVS
ncbi:hypothetical protein BH09ACT4_BH09ACT4_16930 [soil metagenome]